MPNFASVSVTMDLVFALAFISDKILGIVPVPYLLKQDTGGNYSIYKRLTINDLQSDFVNDKEWVGKIIERSLLLAQPELNKKVNPKHTKTTLDEFIKTANNSVLKYLWGWVDNKKIEILNIAKENQSLIFLNKDHYAAVYREDIIGISSQPARVVFEFERKGGELIYRLKLFCEEEPVDLITSGITIITNKQPFIVYQNRLISFENINFNGNKLKPFLTKKEIVVNEKMQGLFFKKFIAPVVKKFDYTIEGFDFTEIKTQVKPYLMLERTFTGEIVFTPVFEYRDHRVEFYKQQAVFVNVLENKGVYSLERIHRDFNYENSLLDRLNRIGFKRKEKCFYLDTRLADIYDFTEYFTTTTQKTIEAAGFRVVNRLFKSEVNSSFPEIEYKTKQRHDWFDLYIEITVGEFRIKFIQLKHHILNGIREFNLSDGTLFIIPALWFTELYPLAKRTNNNNAVKIHKAQLHLLRKNKLIRPDKTISDSLSKLEIKGKPDLPKGITATLRDYQKTGFHWMYHLTQNHFGVCLADDMGLGKTLQVITVLQKYFENKVFDKSVHPPTNRQVLLFDEATSDNTGSGTVSSALLIVPKSLIFNWIEEFNKFSPGLTYTVYHGNNRQDRLKDVFNKVHIIITTYGIVRRDIEELIKFPFSYIVADESQAIKNPRSKIFSSVTALKSDFRIAITGTPIENNLTDLWSQMNFLNPHILGNRKYFEENYAIPVSKDPGGVEAGELKDITGLLLLRRLKKEVARELPEKIEQVIYCEMDESQKAFYESEKSAIRNRILFGGKKETNVINALAMLNKLRQIAIHPRMIEKDREMPSGKFDSIILTMDNLREQGHKFLVFSSFVKHLNLFREYFENNGIPYSMLTGSDNNRREILEGYKNNPDIKPFLISIKAGGQGLNITSANYVLIVDPWWNPFVELQAIDRTHRIGQTHKVVVYRFITKDSVEEKMMRLQQSKLGLSDMLIDQNRSGKLELAEIEKLLDLER